MADAAQTIYNYDVVGNKTFENDGGNDVSYTYDDLNRLTGVNIAARAVGLQEAYTLNDNGTRNSLTEKVIGYYLYPVTSTTVWSYDAMDRLTGETVSYTSSNSTMANVMNGTYSYTNSFTYDLSSNRLSETHVGPGGGADDTTIYVYDGNDQLVSQTDAYSSSTTTTNVSYDLNGSLTSSTLGAVVTNYGYDVRNRMVSFSSGGVTTTYGYDDLGNRVRETTGTLTQLFLTDTNNPTGYSQPIEVTSSMGAAPSMSYELGDTITAQCNASGLVQFLLQDGHGNTRILLNNLGVLATEGQLIAGFFNYDAFSGALNFNPATAGTLFLFGGDAIYDPASGLYLHGNGVRPTNGFLFIQMDGVGYSSNQDPTSLHKYLYANADPVNRTDPGGHLSYVEQEQVAQDGAAIDSWENEGGSLIQRVEDEVDAEEVVQSVEDEYIQLDSEESWGDKGTLTDHFDRHGGDFGAESEEEYAQQGSDLLQRAQREGLPTKIDSNGIIRVYDPKTDEFGSYNPDGTTRTYFRPDPKVHGLPTNWDYWLKQEPNNMELGWIFNE